MSSRFHRALFPCALTVAFLALASTAEAKIVIGQTASALNPPVECKDPEPSDEFQLGVGSEASYVVPTNGVLTSFSTFGGSALGHGMTLKVFRKVGPFSYLVVGQSFTYSVMPNVLAVNDIQIPVQAGDVIGETVPGGEQPTSCAFATAQEGDLVMFAEPSDVPPGGTVVFPGFVEKEFRLNVSATLLPPPTIISIVPTSGSIKGSTKITVTGRNLGGRFSFNGVPTPRATADSESQYTLISPPTKKPTTLQISVTTVAGTATSPVGFRTFGCIVPRLTGTKLKVVRRKLRNARCTLGTVTTTNGATLGTGKVVKQTPKPGTALAPKSRVSVTLGVARN